MGRRRPLDGGTTGSVIADTIVTDTIKCILVMRGPGLTWVQSHKHTITHTLIQSYNLKQTHALTPSLARSNLISHTPTPPTPYVPFRLRLHAALVAVGTSDSDDQGGLRKSTGVCLALPWR
jgi:hypothetical protein